MSYQTVFFRDAQEIFKANGMIKIINQTMQGINEDLAESFYRGTSLRTTLDDCGWRENPESLKIIEGRRYQFKGFWKRIAIEANLNVYEFLWEGLFRLQVGYDKGLIDAGLLILCGNRSEKSPLGESLELVKHEVEELFPTISLPVAITLFDVERPQLVIDNVNPLPDDFDDDFGQVDTGKIGEVAV